MHQKSNTNLKRENQLLIAQSKQLNTALVEERDEKENIAEDDDVFEVENILNDRPTFGRKLNWIFLLKYPILSKIVSSKTYTFLKIFNFFYTV